MNSDITNYPDGMSYSDYVHVGEWEYKPDPDDDEDEWE